MDFSVLRNKKMVDELCDRLKERRLPFKIFIQDIYPLRSLELNDYMWGVVYSTIANETGQSIDDVHEGYKRLYNYTQEFRWNHRTKKMQFHIGATTTIVDQVAAWNYIMKVRADAEISLRICIPMPNETFIRELNFDYERTHKTKTI